MANIRKFTIKSQEALADAQSFAANNPELEPVHLLKALLNQEGVVTSVLKKTGAKFLPIENGILFPNDCRGYFANRQSDHKKRKT